VKVAVTGSTGLIGSHLVASLRRDGHHVVALVRRPPQRPDEIRWDPAAGKLNPTELEGVEAAVNLAGPGIGDRRWTPAYKALVRRARVEATTLLATTLAHLDRKPSVLLSASAVGYYGDRGATPLTEDDGPGTGFLADTCVAWENATQPAVDADIRVCTLRTGIVLAAEGGALGKLLPIYRLGFGGPLGSGRQYQSWITLEDEIAAINFLLTADAVGGPVNVTAPNPVQQKGFAKALGAALHRPALVPTPGIAVRAALGEFATEGVLAGQRALPERLTEAGFAFRQPTIDAAFAAVIPG